jgi:glycosyltransferase involved in cell wall biosynthesis
LKVLIINNDFRVYWKGRLVFLRKYLADQNISFYAVELFGRGSPYAFDSYDNQENWWRCLFPQNSSDELSKKAIVDAVFAELDKINPDVIISSPIVLYAGALSIRWAKKNKKKFIMFDDAKPAQFKRNFLVQGVKDAIIKQADGLWLPSMEYEREYSRLNTNSIHYFYGYSCIDNKRFKIDDDKTYTNHAIVCVARLVPVKNLDILLKTWQLVEQKNDFYRLFIVGNGPEADALVKLTNDLKLNRIEFPGIIANTDLPACYNNADVFILPSLSETWGLVVNEAMAAGLPILLSNKVNACNALLQEGVNGYSFDPLDATQMAGAILKFIGLSKPSKEVMGAKSLEIIGTMDYENMGRKLVSALTEINSKSTKKPGLLTGFLINLWTGKDDHAAWDKLN